MPDPQPQVEDRLVFDLEGVARKVGPVGLSLPLVELQSIDDQVAADPVAGLQEQALLRLGLGRLALDQRIRFIIQPVGCVQQGHFITVVIAEGPVVGVVVPHV